MEARMLAPAAVLVAWSIVMLVWMTATRLPALSKAGIDTRKTKPGGRGQDLEGVLPDRINWKGHNYVHLMEQPTLFYAVSLIIALLGASATAVLLAWAYVGLRIVHSIWQATVNTIPVRLILFAISTLCLAGLAGLAIALTLLA